jgi:hypothetical protein
VSITATLIGPSESPETVRLVPSPLRAKTAPAASIREHGKLSFELGMYKGVLIDETAMVSSFVELTKIFDGTSV